MRVMTAVLVLAMGGCEGDAKITIQAKADLATEQRADDAGLSADMPQEPDLAWTDLAGGVDIAQAPRDMTVPPDLRPLGPDLACAYSIGSTCTTNVQCACTTRNTCDATGLFTGGSYQHCCVYKGDACATSADCCMRPGVGSGVCSASKCQ